MSKRHRCNPKRKTVLNTDQTVAYYNENPSALWIAFAVICLGTFFSTMTVSAVNVAVPEIARELHASAIQVSWLPAAFILANVVFVLPFGRLADRYGRKKVYLIGVTLFSLSSFLAAIVTNIEQLLAVRVLQGVAGSMIFATGMALIISIIPVSRRGMALGVASAFIYLGLACGPIIGGWLTEYQGWRSVFWFQVPFTLVAVILILLKVPGEWKSGLKEPIDWQGAILFMLWSTATFVGISLMPGVYGILLLVMGLLLLAIFVKHQLHREYPLVRFGPVLDNKVFSKSLASSLFIYSATYPLVFLLSLCLQFIRGLSPGEAGQLMVIPALMTTLIAPFSGSLSDKYQPHRVATFGCLITTLGLVLLFGVSDLDTLAYTIAGLLLYGIGFGFFSTPNNNAAMSSVKTERLGIAAALMNLSRTAGNMLGTMTVMLLMSVKIGGQSIQPENYLALTEILYWALTLSCLYALLAARFSFSRRQSAG